MLKGIFPQILTFPQPTQTQQSGGHPEALLCSSDGPPTPDSRRSEYIPTVTISPSFLDLRHLQNNSFLLDWIPPCSCQPIPWK